MSLLSDLPLDRLNPTRLWSHLDPETRLTAARSLYRHDWGDQGTRREADLTIATAMRFRDAAVRQLPVERRAAYLAKNANLGDSLISSLLLALHLEQRRPLLAAFLDRLGIAHDNGVIAEASELKAPPEADLRAAAEALFERFGAPEVEIYLASLVALDADTWGGLSTVLAERARATLGA